MLFEKEKDMLDAFLELVARRRHTKSGWNSEGYDIPYTVGRIQKVLSSAMIRDVFVFGDRNLGREYLKNTAENS